MGTWCKKLISIILVFILLINSNMDLFATIPTIEKSSMTAMQKDLNEIIKGNLSEQVKKTVNGQVKELCDSLTLCMMLSGEEPLQEFNPSINLLYMNDKVIENLLKEKFGNKIEIDKEALVLAREQEKETLKVIKARVQNIWENKRKDLKGTTLVKYLSYLVPAVYLADTNDKEFKEYFKKAYTEYLTKVDESFKVDLANKGFKIKNIKEEARQKELLGLGETITGYSLVKGGVEENDLITVLAVKSAVSELSTIVVPSYITILLEAGQFDLLEKYIDRLGYDEIRSTDTYSKTWIGEFFTLMMPSTHVKRGWNNSSSYAPGAVSRNGYYWDNNKELHNMWEELPAVIASYGAKGQQLLNNIFYKDLVLAHSGQLQPHAEWNKAIIPFMIGAIGTNKIKARPYGDIEKGGKEYSLARYYGANIVGMVELGLLSYKFYDVPSYEYYKHVREIIIKPYWNEIQGKENKARHNFEVRSHLSSQKGEFIGGIYNPENKTGLILHNNKSVWEGGRNILAAELKAAGLADTVISIYFTYQLAVSIAGLAQMVKNGVTLLKAAKSLKALGEKGNLLKIARGIRKGQYDYLIKKPSVKASTKGKVKEVKTEMPKEVTLVDNKGNSGIYNTKTGKTKKIKVNKPKASTVQTATIGEGGSGASAEGALDKVRIRNKRLRTSQNINRELKEMEIETAKAQAEPQKANNIFNKPYSQMNAVEKKIFDTYINLELGGLGDLKAAIKDSKSLLTTRTGLTNTAASSLTFGVGEAPAVEARLMAKAPTEVVSTIEKGKVFESPVTLFDRAGLNTQIGSSGRAVSHFPNTFKVSTPKVKPNLFNGFTGLRSLFTVPANAPLLVRLQKEKELKPFKIAAAITGATIGLTAMSLFSIPAGIGLTLAAMPFIGVGDNVNSDKEKGPYSSFLQTFHELTKNPWWVEPIKWEISNNENNYSNVTGVTSRVVESNHKKKKIIRYKRKRHYRGHGEYQPIKPPYTDEYDPISPFDKIRSKYESKGSLLSKHSRALKAYNGSSRDYKLIRNMCLEEVEYAKSLVKEDENSKEFGQLKGELFDLAVAMEKNNDVPRDIFVEVRDAVMEVSIAARIKWRDEYIISRRDTNPYGDVRAYAVADEPKNPKSYRDLVVIVVNDFTDVADVAAEQIRKYTDNVYVAYSIKELEKIIADLKQKGQIPHYIVNDMNIGYIDTEYDARMLIKRSFPYADNKIGFIMLTDAKHVANYLQQSGYLTHITRSEGDTDFKDVGNIIVNLEEHLNIRNVLDEVKQGSYSSKDQREYKKEIWEDLDTLDIAGLSKESDLSDFEIIAIGPWIDRALKDDGVTNLTYIETKDDLISYVNNMNNKKKVFIIRDISLTMGYSQIRDILKENLVGKAKQSLFIVEGKDDIDVHRYFERGFDGVVYFTFLKKSKGIKFNILDYIAYLQKSYFNDVSHKSQIETSVRETGEKPNIYTKISSVVKSILPFVLPAAAIGLTAMNLFSIPTGIGMTLSIIPALSLTTGAFRYFHELSRNPWKEGIIPGNDSDIAKIESLIEEAKFYGMTDWEVERIRMENINDPDGMKRQLHDFILFIKEGKQLIKERKARAKAKDLTKFIRGKYKRPFNKKTNTLALLFITDDVFLLEDLSNYPKTEKVHIDFVGSYEEAKELLLSNSYSFIFSENFGDKNATEDMANYIKEKDGSPFILYSADKTINKETQSDFDGFLSSSDNNIKEVINYASNYYVKEKVNIPGFVEENYVPFYYDQPFNKGVKKMRILITSRTEKFYRDLQKFLISSPISKYVDGIDFINSNNKVISKLREDPNSYDIIFTDFVMNDGVGRNIEQYVYENGLDIPVVLLSEVGISSQDLFKQKHFAGYLNVFVNDPESTLNYASNLLFKKQSISQEPNFIKENYPKAQYRVPFNTNVKKMRILIINNSYKLFEKVPDFLKTYKYGEYIKYDFVTDLAEAMDKLNNDHTQYDIIFTDYNLGESRGTELSKYVYDNNLDIPVVLLSGMNDLEEDLFYKHHFVGYLDITQNDYDKIFSYASNILAQNGGAKSVPQQKRTVGQIFKNIILPVLPLVAAGVSAAFGNIESTTAALSLASFSYVYGGDISSILRKVRVSKEIGDFIRLREEFNRELFSDFDLLPEEAKEMKRILGEDFFNLWQKYFNKDLVSMARTNPEDIAELAKYSKHFENTLPSQMKQETYAGTNPLYVFAMRDMTNNFIKAINDGKSIEQAITGLGEEMFEYHKKMNQIKEFLDQREDGFDIDWNEVEHPEVFNYNFYDEIHFGVATDYGFGILNTSKGNKNGFIVGGQYGEYLYELKNSYTHPKTYKGVALTEREIKGSTVEITAPNHIRKDGIPNNTFAFNEMQKDLDVIKPIIAKYQQTGNLSEEDLKILHENIADISYIFTNAMPFFRGTSAANLAVVYGLYQMVGIDAPQVTIGRALDLSAFVTSPEQYKKDWTNLFNGELPKPKQLSFGARVRNTFSRENLKNLVLPIASIAAAGVSFALGNPAAGFALASVPFVSFNNTDTPYTYTAPKKPLNLKTDVVRAERVSAGKGSGVKSYAVWKLIGANNEVLAYLKLTTEEEIERTLLLDKIVQENNLQNISPLINFEYPKVLSTKLEDLPEDIIQAIEREQDQIQFYVRNAKKRVKVPLITSPVNTSGFLLGEKIKTDMWGNITSDVTDVSKEAKDALHGKPITNEEWNAIVNLFRKLNEGGLVHGDLMHNLFTGRGENDELVATDDENDKLNVAFVDLELPFRLYDKSADLKYLNDVKPQYEAIGAKEKSPARPNPFDSWGDTIRKTLNDSSFWLPVLTTVLGITFLVSGLSSAASDFALAAAPLALAAIPIVGGIGNDFQFGIENEDQTTVKEIADPELKKFVDLRKNFDIWLFKEDPLTTEEADMMREILGADFFNTWQTYYGRDLKQMAIEEPEKVVKVMELSKMFESTLPTEINSRWSGTNPLYLFTMKKIMEGFENDLYIEHKSMKEAVTNLGQKMFEYHKKIAQIRRFTQLKREVRLGNERKVWRYAIENLKDYNEYNMRALENGFGAAYDIGFGKIPTVYSPSKTRVNPNSIEYWDKIINPYYARFNSYNCVELSVIKTEGFYPNIVSAGIIHANSLENIDRLFEVLQEKWDYTIRGIVDKAKSGDPLSQMDIEALHESISEISFLFTNVVPFYRGSASGNLLLVHGLYDLAGIKVPPIKMGVELDWEAFASASFDYMDNWLNLFDGDFTYKATSQPLPKASSEDKNVTPGTIAAKDIFTWDYKDKIFPRVKKMKYQMRELLPESFRDFLRPPFGIPQNYFRGMVLDYEGLEYLLKNGLLLKDGLINFANNSSEAITFAQRFEFGNTIPVMVKVNPVKQIEKDLLSFFSNDYISRYPISAKDIVEVIAYTEIDGKIGWRKVSLNEKGEVVLQANKDIKTTVAPSENSNSDFKNYILSAIAVSLGVLAFMNPTTAPLALAAMGTGMLASTFSLGNSVNFDKTKPQAETQKPEVKLSKTVRGFIDLHKQFSPELFSGKPLTPQEEQNMKEILGEDFYNLWQKYYNQDLSQVAKTTAQDLEEIKKYSDIFESRLPSQIDNKYSGTNPLFVFAMRDITNKLIADLQHGKTMQSAIENLGQDMNAYHYKIAQIKMFQKYKNEGKKVKWDDLTNIGTLSLNFLPELYFGIPRKKSVFGFNIINKSNYPEYLQDMLNSFNSREDTYKGIKLSTVIKNKKEGRAIVNHPVFPDQKDAFYQVLEKEYKNAKSLIDQRREGKNWSAYLRQRLDRSIATIAYLFANVMPFQRGSASATTALVYALYEMAGIQAPPVKVGRALDLSAFALDLDDYIANFRNLFDGEFEIISQEKSSSTNIAEQGNSNNSSFNFNLPSWVLPAIGGCLLTFSLFSGFGAAAAPLALAAALPLGGPLSLVNNNGNTEQKTIPFKQQALDWGMPQDISRSILESIAWTLGIPQRRIDEVTGYGLWLLNCLYSWMQVGKPINRVHDEKLEALAKKEPNIFKMFPENEKPDFVYIFDEDTNSFKVISLNTDDMSSTVGGYLENPVKSPYTDVEYLDNIIIAGKSIPVFKIKKTSRQNLQISDKVKSDSPILKYVAQYDDPNITEEQILNDPIFNPFHAADGNIYTHEQVLQRIKEAKDNSSTTAQEFKAFGTYSNAIYRPERQELHDEIIRKIFNGYKNKVREHPTFIMLGGRAGSGKTSNFEGRVFDKEHYLVIGADIIKEMLPEYKGYNNYFVQMESVELIDRILKKAIDLKVNVVLDFTMKTMEAVKRRLQMFKDEGYRTEAHYMFAPRQEAAKRAIVRFLDTPKGRYTSLEYILKSNNALINFDIIKDYVDAWGFYDNNVPYGTQPKIITRKGTFSYEEYKNSSK